MIEQVIAIVYFLIWTIASVIGFAVCLLNLRDARADLIWTTTEYGTGTLEHDIAFEYVRREAVRLVIAFLFLLTVIATVTLMPLVGAALVLANVLVATNSIGERSARKRQLGGGHTNGDKS